MTFFKAAPVWALASISVALPAGQAGWPAWQLTLLGVMLGTLARYALRFQDHKAITWREVVVDIGLLGFMIVLTLYAAERLGATGLGAVVLGMIFGVGQEQVMRFVRRLLESRAIERRAAKMLGIPELAEEAGPPPAPEPPTGEQAGTPDSTFARAGNALLSAYGRKPTGAPPDHIALLREIDKEDDR